eukprot:TRINITY_DN7211_c0_g1_i1.p1 TRINITY_DN7211_c0_g1~~TRINITY_DN7211_c0_g1_i1.p1  ORF type:complete len:347 (-),score=96.93 TRINITY_DN7211_c0_g1_i1:120-1160(-)
MFATVTRRMVVPSLGALRHRMTNSSVRCASSLVVAEHNGGVLNPATLSAVTAAGKVGGDVTVLVAGDGSSAPVAQAAASIKGVAKVVHATSDALGHGLAEPLTDVVKEVQQSGGYTHVFTPATTFGKNFMPRLAAQLDVSQVSDVSEVVSEDTFVRPVYAGNALSTVKSVDPIKVVTVRTTSFEKAPAEGGSAAVEAVSPATPNAGLSSWDSQELTKSERPDLSSASVVVSGGRALKSAENFKIIEDLCTPFNAAMGASRAAVDAGYVPNDLQVGQTGKIVAPELYFAIGISGAIQHLAGMKDSKTIVAINKDPDAPIFQVSDFGIVGDLFDIVPQLTEAVKAAKQ